MLILILFITAVEISVDEMEVDNYEEEPDVLDLYDSNYGSMTTFTDFPMDESSTASGGGALALMPPIPFQDPIIPAELGGNPSASNSSSASILNDPMHQTVLQVVLASNKPVANVEKKHNTVSTSSGNQQPPTEVMVYESMLTLLLKLHSKLSAVPDSYLPFWDTPEALKLKEEAKQGIENGFQVTSVEGEEEDSFSYSQLYDLLNPSDSRIGDGPFFIAKVLDKISAKDEACRKTVIFLRERIWPKNAEDEEAARVREEKEKAERRKKAKERQMKLMAEFAKKQQQFMEKAMTEEEFLEEMTGEESSDSFSGASRDGNFNESIKPLEYDCVICNQTSASTSENPMGLVILLQPSSVLGRRVELGEKVNN
jgi:E3 ubiquitin-protein ligase UBR3